MGGRGCQGVGVGTAAEVRGGAPRGGGRTRVRWSAMPTHTRGWMITAASVAAMLDFKVKIAPARLLPE